MEEQLEFLFEFAQEMPSSSLPVSKKNPKYKVSDKEHEENVKAFIKDAAYFVDRFIQSTIKTAFGGADTTPLDRAYALSWLLEDLVPINSNKPIEPTSFQGLCIALGADPWSIQESLKAKWNKAKLHIGVF